MTTRSIRDWIIEHDDRWLFIILYVGLAVVLSVWISLFWLIVVVAGHFVLEWIRQSHLRPHGRGIFWEVLWELKLDIALVLFALALTLYMNVLLGVVGLRSATKLGAMSRAGTRFEAWERTLRGLLLSADDAAQVVRAVTIRAARRGRPAAAAVAVAAEAGMTPMPAAAPLDPQTERLQRWGGWVGEWGLGDRITVGLAVACVLLILAAPWLTDHTYMTAVMTMAGELHPFPAATLE